MIIKVKAEMVRSPPLVYCIVSWPTCMEIGDAYQRSRDFGLRIDQIFSDSGKPVFPTIPETPSFGLENKKVFLGVLAYPLTFEEDPYYAPYEDIQKYFSWRDMTRDLHGTSISGFKLGLGSCDIIYENSQLLALTGRQIQNNAEMKVISHCNLIPELKDFIGGFDRDSDMADLSDLDVSGLLKAKSS